MLKTFCAFLIILLSISLLAQSKITSISPANKSILYDSSVIIKWNPSYLKTASSSYSLTVGSDSLFNSVIYSKSGISSNADTLSLSFIGKYFWKVELLEGPSKLSSSDIFSFRYANIFSIYGLSLILCADSGVLLDANNKVARWLNLADTTNSAVQPAASSRPTLVINSAGIKPSAAIRLDGIDDMMEINSSFSTSDYFVIANWGGPQSKFPSYNGLLAGKTGYYFIIGNPVGAGTSFLINSPLFSINNKVSNDFSPLNQTKLISSKSTSSTTRTDMLIGRDRTFSTRHWNGDISEIIIAGQSLSDSLRNIVNKYLCQKYSNTLSLGADIIVPYGFCDTLVQVDTNFISYRWSNGDTTSASRLTPGNTYRLTVINKFGCSYTDEIYVTTPVKPKNGATLCLGETYTWNTALSKTDYSFLWSNFSTDSVLLINQPGDYFVRITDTNNCYYDSDTITINYDSTLANASLGPDTAICLGYEIGLQNPPVGITSYLWNTNQTIPRIVPQSTGLYWLEVTANGCTKRDSIFITIRGDAPTADFIANDVCFGDSIDFLDVSINPSLGIINQWRWSFGNTQGSQLQNPTVLYDSVKTYTVSLYIETDAQCSDSISKTVTINPKPQAGFFNSLACKGDSVFFTDSSSITSGSIQYWRWKYNDLNQSPDTSRLQNPATVFSNAQNFPIQLIVTSDLGCKDTLIQNLKVNDLPRPDYVFTGNCLGDSTTFTNYSSYPQGTTLKSISWNFGNNSTSTRINPTIFYSTPKIYLVKLETELNTGCKATIQRQFEMNDKPVANFNTSEFCLKNFGQVNDLSTVTRTTLSSWKYHLNQVGGYKDSAFIQNPSFKLTTLNEFELIQQVTSLKGCKDTASKVIQVRNNPKALFNLQTNTGGAPFELKFDTITPSHNYEWSFGNGDSAFVYRPTYVYQDTGIYSIKLLLRNEFGCIDSMKRSVNVKIPNLNLLLDTIVVDQTNNLVRIGVVLINSGNNEINSVRMSANLNSSYRIEETWKGQLFPNDFVYTEFTSSVSLGASGINDFTCVEILAVNDMNDLDLLKDEVCVKGTGPRLFLKGYPNPTDNNMTVEMVIPNEGTVTAKVYDNKGREQFRLFDEERSEGFYRFEIQSAVLNAGIYYLIVEYKGATYKLPFIKK